MNDIGAAQILRLRFTTSANSVPTTLAGTPAISVYKDGSTVESTAGVTLTVDFDSRTGLNLVAIDTSADATFYSAGSDFDVVITAGIVAGNSVVGVVIDSFSISNRKGILLGSIGPESYAADGVEPTLAQMLFMLWSSLSEFAISGTTIAAKKLDGATTAMTFTLNSSTAPTSRTRAT